MIRNKCLQVGRPGILILLLTSLLVFSGCQLKNSRAFTFTYTVNLESTNGEKVELWLPFPKSNEVQVISNIDISCEGLSYEIKKEKKHNNKYLYIYNNDGINKSTVVEMFFDVLRFEHQNMKYSDVNPNDYLEASSMVPIGDVFSQIIEINNLNHDDMRGLYDYVLSGMHYGKPKSKDNQYYNDPWLSADKKYGIKKVSRDKVVELYKKSKVSNSTYTFGNGNSLYACDIGVGNCTDYHSYFISLSRTMEVPARFHMGFPIPSGNEGKVKGYHCWADYYIDGEGWFPVDISEADKDPSKIEYFFGTVDESRVEMMAGRDFKLEGLEQEMVTLFIYPILEIGDKESKAFTKYFSYKNL